MTNKHKRASIKKANIDQWQDLLMLRQQGLSLRQIAKVNDNITDERIRQILAQIVFWTGKSINQVTIEDMEELRKIKES